MNLRLLKVGKQVFGIGLLFAGSAHASPQAVVNPRANPVSAEGSKENGKPSTPAPVVIDCPTRGLSAPQVPAKSGRHTVLLTWKANAPYAHAAGYCLYRRRDNKGIPSRIADCGDCQLVSDKSIPGTRCVDDRVEDNATYFYVVTAATAGGSISPGSNEARAEIHINDIPKASSAPQYPLCRSK